MFEVSMRPRVEGRDLYCALEYTDASGEKHKLEPHELSAEKESYLMKELRAMLIGMQRMKKPSHITVYTKQGYIRLGIEYMAEWEEKGWLKSDGKEVKYKDLWREIRRLSKQHEISVVLE